METKLKIEYVDLGCRMMGINLSIQSLEKILALIELIETKGGATTIEDIVELQNTIQKKL